RDSVTAEELRRHVEALANDTFEGREAGTRGGYAAAGYITQYLTRHKLKPAGDGGTYFQAFSGNYRNLLGLLEGSDPVLKQQVIVVGAHYDHVGYGSSRNSFGPTGYIHNGADDNASGDAALLELIDAFDRLEVRPKRSILFAFWDGEEKGLLGSKHWVAKPTIPLSQIACALNIDMVGRLRQDLLTIYGTRTLRGVRRLLSDQNQPNLALDFNWEMKSDSDHYSFYERQLPVLMFHTGLHSDYHRPSDDVEKLNFPGLERIDRLMFGTVLALADDPNPWAFRSQSRQEGLQTRPVLERLEPALPGRLGLGWSTTDAGPGLLINEISPNSAAARAGLRLNDRILKIDGHALQKGDDPREFVWAAGATLPLVIERSGEAKPLDVAVQLGGGPLRVGITWREDEAEPGSLFLIRVVPGTPADKAGLRALDRVYSVNGQSFANGVEFAKLLEASTGSVELLVEQWGRERTVTVPLKAKAEAAESR
ncbi:MAG TPA: M20/M25/M40 family metallo-hydrolase, partial [Pirellulales bacterium]|nr:M20/M25/M40 family metallo-hydrolase [Pirellulales bacterium]